MKFFLAAAFKIIRQAYENNSDSKSASNTDYFNYGQRAALRDWKNTHMNAANHSQQSHSTSANSSQEQKTGTTQQVSQQATHSNSQANSNSKDQAQKFNQVQRDYGISY
jgi:Mg-chelatase subunit ChlI